MRYSRLNWVLADVVGLFSVNPVLIGPIFSAIVVPYQLMLSGPAIYVLGPLQVAGTRHQATPAQADEAAP